MQGRGLRRPGRNAGGAAFLVDCGHPRQYAQEDRFDKESPLTTKSIRSLALVVVLLAGATSQAQVDVSGNWNFCLGLGERPPTVLTQVGTQVTGAMTSQTFSCSFSMDIDPATGAFVPGTDSTQCSGSPAQPVALRPALATTDRIDGEFANAFNPRLTMFGLRSCDPMVIGACDDGDPTTTDTCSTSVDCSGTALAASCVHTGCTTDADCTDAYFCTYDRCSLTTGCAHPTVLQAGEAPLFCEDGDPCTVLERCNLTTCPSSSAFAVATTMMLARVTLGRLGAPGGDDRLAVKGRVQFPTSPPADQIVNYGIRVLVIDADGATVVDETLPGGEFDPLSGVGWSFIRSGVRYADKRKVGQGAIRKVSIKSDLAGLVRFAIAGKAGTYLSPPTLPLAVYVDLDTIYHDRSHACATFPGPSSPTCVASNAGTKVRCR
jgi:hypothetical protein